jgi:hypothetical protein
MHDLIRSEIAVPIISDEEVIAVICLNPEARLFLRSCGSCEIDHLIRHISISSASNACRGR